MGAKHDSVDLVEPSVVRPFARAAILAAVMSAFAYVSIPLPFSPVPLTLQALGVFLAGLFLGPYWGGASMGLYLVAGAAGAPVFANGNAGLGTILGPTGGYLVAFPIAAVVIGLLVHRGGDLRDPAAASLTVLVGSLVVGTVVIHAPGVAWLSWVLEIGVREAFALGSAPYLPGAVIKIAMAIAIVRSRVIETT